MRTLFGGNSVLVKHDSDTDMPWRDPKTNFCVKTKTGDVGELLNWVDAKAIDEKFAGYLGNDKASSSKIMRDVFKKGDAYYRTGDLQRMDADGRWWFVSACSLQRSRYAGVLTYTDGPDRRHLPVEIGKW